VSWVYLLGAILAEVLGTMTLRVAADGRRSWYIPVVAGYVLSFLLLAAALREGLGIGVAYGIWTALGVALTAWLSKLLFGEPLTRTMVLGMVLVVAGVALLETGQH
jgi:small multidrug resistance pump